MIEVAVMVDGNIVAVHKVEGDSWKALNDFVHQNVLDSDVTSCESCDRMLRCDEMELFPYGCAECICPQCIAMTSVDA